MQRKSPAERVRDYFDRDAADYDSYFDRSARTRSLGRLLAKRVLSPKAAEKRLEAALELCGDVAGKRVLEVGCGPGRYSIALARRGADVLGIDVAPGMIRLATRLAEAEGQSARCRFEVGDALDHPFPAPFHVSLATGVLDYIEPAGRVPLLARMRELSSEAVVVSFPKRWHVHAALRQVWLWARRVPVYFYTPADIARLFAAAGLREVDSRDIGILTVRKAVPRP